MFAHTSATQGQGQKVHASSLPPGPRNNFRSYTNFSHLHRSVSEMRVPTYVALVFTSPFDFLFVQDQTLSGILRAVVFISLLSLLICKNMSFVITICLWVTITTTSQPPDLSGNLVRTVCPEDTQDPQTVYGNSKPSKKILLLFKPHFAYCNSTIWRWRETIKI